MYAVILAGGSGNRLWPLSREQFPKQLLSLGEHSLFQETLLRATAVVPAEKILIVTLQKHQENMQFQFQEVLPGITPVFLVEPEGKNTAPAIALAARYLHSRDPEAVMAVLPADHIIDGTEAFTRVLEIAKEAAEKYGLVTIGIKPVRPETGYGYIRQGKNIVADIYKVERFVEKPCKKLAEEYFKAGNYLWNSGMFVFKTAELLAQYRRYLPETAQALEKVDCVNLSNLKDIYSVIEPISIDYGLLEKSSDITVIPAEIHWSDIGSWDAVHKFLPKDTEGNSCMGNVLHIDTSNSLLYGHKRVIAAVGLADMVVVDTEDATLVCQMKSTQQIREVVKLLKGRSAKECQEPATVKRPWGSYTVIGEGKGYKLKNITVKPGGSLSLQRHKHRSEHWVVIGGKALVTLGEKEYSLKNKQSIDIPAGINHRLANAGTEDLHIIEIQSGPYLEEDDIIRIKDNYSRVQRTSLIEKEQCYQEYVQWLENCRESAEQYELESLTDEEIKARFASPLGFGTGGLRGPMALGSSCMNKYVVRRAAQGLANYLNKSVAEKKKVAIAYDSRHNSRLFAQEAASVLAANGINAYLFDDMRPTPVLSYAVRYLECTSGIVVTASHNPTQDNGFKVYNHDGGQAVPRLADIIKAEMDKLDYFKDIQYLSLEEAVNKGLVTFIGLEIDSDYLEKVLSLSLYRGKGKENLRIIYSPLHGTGKNLVPAVLKKAGFKSVIPVLEQMAPDPNFSTVKTPNPENPENLKLAVKKAVINDADIILATDPDCDRVGCMVKTKSGDYTHLTGNQVGVLLLNFILERKRNLKELTGSATVIKTVVTSDLGRKIASAYGVEMEEVLTGFKFIGEKIREFQEKGKVFLFGYEESCGYLTGTFVRDKDAIISSLLIAEMAAFYKDHGKTLLDAMEEIYSTHGYYEEEMITFPLPSREKISVTMDAFGKFRSQRLGNFYIKEIRNYYSRQAFLPGGEGEIRILEFPANDSVQYFMKDGSWFCLRPSGTEPIMKLYFSVNEKNKSKTKKKMKALKGITLGIFNQLIDDEAAAGKEVLE